MKIDLISGQVDLDRKIQFLPKLKIMTLMNISKLKIN